MATEIRVPTLGESVTEATIGQWFKKVGDAVAADEPLVELETDKVTIEVPAPSAGVLETITANPGDTVNVGALIGAIAAGAAAAAAAPAAAAPAPAAAPAAPAAAEAPKAPAAANGTSVPPAPSAAKLMAENGISDGDLSGSGKRGQVLKEDPPFRMGLPRAGIARSKGADSSHGRRPYESLAHAAYRVPRCQGSWPFPTRSPKPTWPEKATTNQGRIPSTDIRDGRLPAPTATERRAGQVLTGGQSVQLWRRQTRSQSH